MKAKNKISLFGALIISLPFVTEMAPAATKSKAKNTLALKAPVSSIAYGESVADIDCSNVSAKITQVKPLLPIISNAATQGTINIEKDEFETTEQFQIRQFKHIQTLLGGTGKFVVIQKLDSVFSILKYNADLQAMEVSSGYEKDVYHSAFGFQSIKLTQDTLQTSYYQARNAYGVSRNVESKSNVRTALLFAQEQIPKEYQAAHDLLSVPMTSESARAFKANPIRIVIADLRMPTVNYENFNTKATIDYPYASSLGSYGFSVDVKCIVFMSGVQEILRVNMTS